MRYLITVSYDGSNYYGFEVQPDKMTIQGCLESALKVINKKHVTIKGAGRTDRGVHAYGQVFHVDLDVNVPENGLMSAMNSLLPNDIHITNVKKVSKDIHARFSAKKKTYIYKINIGEYDAINNSHIYNYNKNLDINLMKEASKYLIGMHDYEAYVTGKRDNYNSIIYDIDIYKENSIIYFKFIGKSFYTYMVRNMMGALVLVGAKKIEPICIKEMLDNKENIYHYVALPSNGLYLMKIEYDNI